MAILTDYFAYLDHFGPTVPVATLHDRPGRRHAVGLRHDVDYDLDLALEMAYHEHRRGDRATYFLLHTADYWDDPDLADKCLQLQDFGHEVGLHVNLITQWARGEIDDIDQALEQLLGPLRQAGVNVRGVAAHGDRACYEHGFANHWCFAELRGEDPQTSEHLRTAEGPPADDPTFQLPYPPSHELCRDDGARLKLWSSSLAAHGLAYHAFHVPHDRYFTDSGGTWTRSPDPLDYDLATGRTQVLMHPIHWRGPQRLYIFLGTARSGSKYLAHMLERATNLTARHEFLLNHRYENQQLRAEQHTALGFTDLQKDPGTTRTLLREGRAYLESQPGDQAEVNVYLPHFLPLLDELFPDATVVHLERNPADVVRSILNRNWYDTPEDTRHPTMDVAQWDTLPQFDKVCWYVRCTTESLRALTRLRIHLEPITDNLATMLREFEALGLAVYPRLAAAAHAERVNATTEQRVPAPARWPAPMRRRFEAICAPLAPGEAISRGKPLNRLGQMLKRLGQDAGDLLSWRGHRRHLPPPVAHWLDRPAPDGDVHALMDHLPGPGELTAVHCTITPEAEGLSIQPDGKAHAHVLLGGGAWRKGPTAAWTVEHACYYRGRLELTVSPNARVNLMALFYDAAGNLALKKPVLEIDAAAHRMSFSFRPPSDVATFNLALYMPLASQPEHARLTDFTLDRVALRPAVAWARPSRDRGPLTTTTAPRSTIT